MKSHKRHQPSISLIITVLLLFSTGQVLTVAHAHSMNTQDQSQSMSQDCDHMTQLDHRQQSMNHSNMSDCCETLCQCPQAMCATILLLTVRTQSTQFIANKSIAQWVFEENFHLNKEQSTLYRPPII